MDVRTLKATLKIKYTCKAKPQGLPNLTKNNDVKLERQLKQANDVGVICNGKK
jgi:hypothetical protein